MVEKTLETYCGRIHYWTNEEMPERKTTLAGEDREQEKQEKQKNRPCDSETALVGECREQEKQKNRPFDPVLIFLPGLTADHRLFEKQVEYFEKKCRILVWDAPEHAASRPFYPSFDLTDKAKWLDEILQQEGIDAPVIVGQSMGGYVGQMYLQLFPGKAIGFISIDSAPLQRQYITAAELWLLERMEPVYLYYPWKSLLELGSNGVATSEYGRKLMRDIMMTYDGNQKEYAWICGHGYNMLAKAIEADLPYEIDCPALLICGEKDHAGSCIRYNKAWHKKSGIPIKWIKGAGHNSNTDAPETINRLIEMFIEGYKPAAELSTV